MFYLFCLNQNMQLLTILGIAVALAMDAFAVDVATGVNLKNISYRQTFRLSWHFGLFQALMPIIGWWLGTSIQSALFRIFSIYSCQEFGIIPFVSNIIDSLFAPQLQQQLLQRLQPGGLCFESVRQCCCPDCPSGNLQSLSDERNIYLWH